VDQRCTEQEALAAAEKVAELLVCHGLSLSELEFRPKPSGFGRAMSTPRRTPAEADPDGAKRQWRTIADQLRPRVPKLAALMDEAEEDVLAFMAYPREHRAKICSTNPLERVNGEIKRRTDVVGIFPNEAAITRLVGAILLEQSDEWAIGRRYMSL
jgi:transposase-like protein